MKKKKSTVQNQESPVAIPVGDTKPFGRTFILKDNLLVPESEFPEQVEFLPLPPLNRQDCSSLVFANRALIFGEKTIGLNAKSDTDAHPWDALIFDFGNQAKPRLYLLAIASGITETMLTMITLNACIVKKENRAQLTSELITTICKNKRLKKVFDAHLVEGNSLEAMLEQAVSKSLQGLCITTVDDQDGVKLLNSYRTVHSHSIDVIYLHKYRVGKSTILSVVPPFSELKMEESKQPREKVAHSEADHFAKASQMVQAIYGKLKTEAEKIAPKVQFNPNGKHYVSMKLDGGKNLAFLHFRKNGLYVVVKLEEQLVRQLVKKSTIHSLPESVQKFWNGSSTGITISSLDAIKELVEVFKRLLKK